MDGLATFLKSASWKKDDRELYFCDDPGLKSALVQATNDLPDYLRGYGFQAWKVLEETKVLEKNGIGKRGFIIPVAVISGQPRLLSEPSQPILLPGLPIAFEREPRITPGLYLLLALPPSSK
ncbi:hypothetical protein CNMCM8980_010209 [Aspergillus fumigatiaffinis]|jgi:hypothetical protein|uniref:Uncharacterized protein n=1 Tax=Aspergillus fumigatiaffinis TaxID=340414 RepID=A0A8H4GPC2_9EURO|nr:hypothetical protein CNMCM5878_007070 [Aspergillus fumigatiaffinis]KAF4225813.1 hypothetical protein CNMCM6805_005879 [Aspergillus fumigatiaffinis]KAF4241238.1 hypothetical protein CNMCM6457_006341 [Aspergillus fumigatiaffinis]KAF4244397.1 hypothetical protein CNMCM8980_010209 [Aspergillus fumigatiaffinis]